MNTNSFNISNTQNPNIFGEFLRELFFTKKLYKSGDKMLGCYDNFELEKDFIVATKEAKNDINKILNIIFCEEDLPNFTIYIHKDNPKIFVAWFWDGDGSLFISDGGQVAYNGDCKKDYTWEFV